VQTAVAQQQGGPVESGRFLRWLRRKSTAWGTDPGLYDPALVRTTLSYVRRLIGPHHYFGLDARGLEQVPETPSMIVSNHSGGTTIPDVWGLALAWYDRFGVGRPLHGIVHEIILATDATGSFFSRMGAVRGNRVVALEILQRWKRDLLVLPGGDLDAWRPHADRFRVRFGGRTGYARTAIRAQVPVVPVAHAGAHETLMVLTDGRRIAQALHFHELFRADIFPIHLSLPWVIGIGPWPHLPTPVTLRYRFGRPIPPPEWTSPDDPPEDLVSAHDLQIRAALQGLLDELRLEQATRH
jgi:1-acyl-sn-glycerol-3-phosphate acyltransferase